MPFFLRASFWREAVSLVSQQLRAMFSVTQTVQYIVHPPLSAITGSTRVILEDAQGTLWIISCPSALVEEMLKTISNGSVLTPHEPRTDSKGSSAEA